MLDFITIICQSSKSYHKEVGEYDYDKDNFPTYVVWLPVTLYSLNEVFEEVDAYNRFGNNKYALYSQLVWTVFWQSLVFLSVSEFRVTIKMKRPRNKKKWHEVVEVMIFILILTVLVIVSR
ncbi:MAG: hypothetical protein IJX86_02585 [Lachnospiraceae bacterium]|nr:hypothetical protein [Lachnospiraceae bacterium]